MSNTTGDILGLAYCSVTLISLLGFGLGQKVAGEKTQFWSRVWMLPVLTILFTLAIIFSFRNGYIAYPLQLTVALLGYTWFLISLAIILSRKFSCHCGKKTSSSRDLENIETRPDCVENIYENDPHFQKPFYLI